jgi:nucleotide-binding universal stress UspA family protein
MTIKDIFTIVDVNNERMVASSAALELASRVGAHATGLALAMEPLAPGFLASPIPAEYLVEAINASENAAKEAAKRFDEKAVALGVPAESRNATVYSGGTPVIVRQAQLSDLVVIGQENPDQPEPMRSALLEALLFDAGVPLLIIPYDWVKPVSFDKIMIAWDGSSTSARAVHAALPVLKCAKSIEIAMVSGSKKVDGVPGADAATYLARHGLNVTVEKVERQGNDVTATLVNRAGTIGADLCVMGGYGHNRFREFVLGGVTRNMLEQMTIPTLMSH